MLQIAICDDENGDISIVQILISDCLLNSGIEYELSTFRTARSFLLSVNKEAYSPDILILDIVLDSASGIDIAKDLNHLLPHCQIIFISNYDDYVSDVYAVNHCYFIRKKEVTKHFRHALQKSINNLSLKQFISLRTEGEFRRLEVDSILYMERDLRRTHIHCIDKEFTCYTKPDAMISGLNSSPFLAAVRNKKPRIGGFLSCTNKHFKESSRGGRTILRGSIRSLNQQMVSACCFHMDYPKVLGRLHSP